ncbi:hypothetical protein AABB24_031087, partial [Solanum stoloniferum]
RPPATFLLKIQISNSPENPKNSTKNVKRPEITQLQQTPKPDDPTTHTESRFLHKIQRKSRTAAGNRGESSTLIQLLCKNPYPSNLICHPHIPFPISRDFQKDRGIPNLEFKI